MKCQVHIRFKQNSTYCNYLFNVVLYNNKLHPFIKFNLRIVYNKYKSFEWVSCCVNLNNYNKVVR